MINNRMTMAARISPRRSLMLCTIAYASIYVARLNLSVASPLLSRENIMTTADIGLMGGFFFAVYAIGRFVNGYVGDALPARTLLVFGLAVVGAANLGIGLLPPVAVIILLWGINGLAQSMLWGPALRTVNAAYMDSPFRQKAAIILSMGIGAGSLIAIMLATVLANVGLWAMFAVPGLLALAVCVPLAYLPKTGGMQVLPHWRTAFVLLKRREILCRLFPAAVQGAVKDNLMLWAPLLFMDIYGINLGRAAAFVFLMPAAMLLGRVVYPVWERWCGGEYRAAVWAFLCCALCLAPFLFLRLPALLAAVLLALAALMVSVINAAFMAVHPLRYAAEGRLSMVAGLLDAVAYVGSAVGAAVFGWLIGQDGYLPMIAICAALAVLSAGSMLAAREKREENPAYF